jgi:hypothetical protein
MYFVTGATVFSAFAFLGGAGVGLFPGSRRLLHPLLRRPGDRPLVLPGAPGRPPRSPVRVRDPGPAPGGPLPLALPLGPGGRAEHPGVHPLHHPPDAGGGDRHRGGDRGTDPSLGGGGRGVRDRPGLRAGERGGGRGLDQHPSGDLHAGDRLDPGALPSLGAPRRDRPHVPRHPGQPPGTPGASRPHRVRGPLELGRVLLGHPGECRGADHVAASLHEGLHRPGRPDSPPHGGPLSHLPALPPPRLPHRVCRGDGGGPAGAAGLHPPPPGPLGGPSGDRGRALLRGGAVGVHVHGRRPSPCHGLGGGGRRHSALPGHGGGDPALPDPDPGGGGRGHLLRLRPGRGPVPGGAPPVVLRDHCPARPTHRGRHVLAPRHHRGGRGRPPGRVRRDPVPLPESGPSPLRDPRGDRGAPGPPAGAGGGLAPHASPGRTRPPPAVGPSPSSLPGPPSTWG